jgi:hypothetical protein
MALVLGTSACTGAADQAAPNPASPIPPTAATTTPGQASDTAINAGAAGSAPTIGTAPTPQAAPAPTTPASGTSTEMGNAPGMPATATKRYPDACDERRGSWHTPCANEPDPCHLNSGFAGDNYCLLPPPEGEGIQIHFGPKDYNDPDEIAKYTIQPGEEFNQYAIVNVPTTEDRWYGYLKLSMRPGSHHLINTLIAGHPPEGFVKGGCEGESIGSFPGTQNLIVESPPQGIPAPENEGLGRKLPGNSSICQNYHRYNTTDKPAISEIWYNVWFMKEDEITQRANGVSVTAGPYRPIPPHSKQSLTATSMMRGDGRILSLFGHRHAATERFAVWLNDNLIYDSWDWVESRLFNYDSLTQNPAPMPDKKIDGAASGVLEYKMGDALKIQCDVNNTTDVALRFANELYTGEMCILFGSSVGAGVMANSEANADAQR